MSKHAHNWQPVSRAIGSGPHFAFKTKAEPWRPAKPRGYEQPGDGDAVLWACDHSWSEYDKKTRQHKRHYCVATLTHPEMWRLKNKGEFTEAKATPPEAPQRPTTARERLEAARRLRSQQ